ncbi:hypothetical protein KIL84_000795 [Mauremys mutica]|uniref:Uncharacterized protein n=1 Tax=Mauremys mutica TaxID=74926 RepID=A0A9D3WZF3_9SAUR|nr:hypothetical protein KIL84_000795 [Mauremys mutica]
MGIACCELAGGCLLSQSEVMASTQIFCRGQASIEVSVAYPLVDSFLSSSSHTYTTGFKGLRVPSSHLQAGIAQQMPLLHQANLIYTVRDTAILHCSRGLNFAFGGVGCWPKKGGHQRILYQILEGFPILVVIVKLVEGRGSLKIRKQWSGYTTGS